MAPEQHGEDAARPVDYAQRLRERAATTDRSGRFSQRLAEVERGRRRRVLWRRVLRIGLVPLGAGVGVLVLLVLAAVLNGPLPGAREQLLAAGVGAVVGAIGPVVRDALARRRGASAWDWHRERYVLLGDPSRRVRDADRPDTGGDGPPLPPPRR